ncbi:MAG: hypothetical protein ABNH16_06975 [Thalassolituus sp.]|jgi:hypothetical protein
MSISTRRPADTYSILIAESVIPRANHTPIPVDVTKNGQPLTVWLLRGLEFKDEAGEAVTPLGYLSNEEFFTLRTMLEHADENDVYHERTLPMDWDEIDALVTKKREEAAAESTELGNEQEQQP